MRKVALALGLIVVGLCMALLVWWLVTPAHFRYVPLQILEQDVDGLNSRVSRIEDRLEREKLRKRPEEKIITVRTNVVRETAQSDDKAPVEREPSPKPVPADDTDRRLQRLEEELKAIKGTVAPTALAVDRLQQEKAKETLRHNLNQANRSAFVDRMEKERTENPEAFKEADTLYSDGMKDLRENQDPSVLEELVKRQPQTNRGACGAIQLGQHYLRNGEFEEAKRAFDVAFKYGEGAYFKDGIEVTPQALFYQGIVASKAGRNQDAEEFWTMAQEQYPHASTHEGAALSLVIQDELLHLQQEERDLP